MEIVIAIAILGGLGLIFGLVLAAASKVFYVETDPRLDALNETLPGANCGGCGYAGCGGYAEAVLSGEAPIGACASGGNECAQAMAAIMGVEATEVKRMVAFVRCAGYHRVDGEGKEQGAKKKAQYEGFHDCLAASKVGGNGPLACKFGCLGFGSCVKACKYDAIRVKDGVATVEREKCVGCMACVRTCPRKIIAPVEYEKQVFIPCASHAKGAVTIRGCSDGCIGCGMCVKVCENKAIYMDRGLARINPKKCNDCGLCAEVCPRKIILNLAEAHIPASAAK